jgi:hypothetical protein
MKTKKLKSEFTESLKLNFFSSSLIHSQLPPGCLTFMLTLRWLRHCLTVPLITLSCGLTLTVSFPSPAAPLASRRSAYSRPPMLRLTHSLSRSPLNLPHTSPTSPPLSALCSLPLSPSFHCAAFPDPPLFSSSLC